MVQNVLPCLIAEVHIPQLHHGSGGIFRFRGHRLLLRLGQKVIDPANARHGGLDGLDLHAQTFQRREDLADVVHYRHGGTGGHAEQRQHRRVSGGGQQHNNAHHSGVHREDHGGIQGVIEVGALNGPVALPQCAVIPGLHVGLLAQCADGAEIPHRLRHISGGPTHRLPVFQLIVQHPLLDEPGKEEQHRQQCQQQIGKSPAALPHHDQNAENPAGVRRHADDPGGEQGLHRVHVPHEAGHQRPRLLTVQLVGGQAALLFHQAAPQGVGGFLAEYRQRTLPGGFQSPCQCGEGQVPQWQAKGQPLSGGETVHDAAQHQRRHQRRAYGPCHHRQNGKGQPEVVFHRFQYHSPHMDCFFAVIHGCSPLCASNCAA